jgi:hypothetical protein
MGATRSRDSLRAFQLAWITPVDDRTVTDRGGANGLAVI